MSTDPTPEENQPEIVTPLIPEADTIQNQHTEAMKEEGGATAENLVLSSLGLAGRSLDQFRMYCKAHGMLELTAAQTQVLLFILTEQGCMGARQAARMARDGIDISAWAAITQEESHAIALANLDAMTDRAGAIQPPRPEENAG